MGERERRYKPRRGSLVWLLPCHMIDIEKIISPNATNWMKITEYVMISANCKKTVKVVEML